jgi:hypothetical protein
MHDLQVVAMVDVHHVQHRGWRGEGWVEGGAASGAAALGARTGGQSRSRSRRSGRSLRSAQC